MNMCMRTLILGAAIGIAPATISSSQAGMIGPGNLQITEPASLVEPVRARMGGRTAASRGSAGVRETVHLPIYSASRSLNLKAAQVPGRRVIYSPNIERPYTVRRGDTLSGAAASVYRPDRR